MIVRKKDPAKDPMLRERYLIASTLREATVPKYLSDQKAAASEQLGLIKGILIGFVAGGIIGWILGFVSRT